MTTVKHRTKSSRANGQASGPAWEIAELFPDQGDWTVEDYLELPGNRLIEFSDGVLEFLPMPTTMHQWIVLFLWESLKDFAGGWDGLGLALTAPLRVRLREGKFREPDLAFMLTPHKQRAHEAFWEGADLVIEVPSKGAEARRHDLITKRREYARARIPEYWIVDNKLKQITVLRLKEASYEVHGVFKSGQRATSRLLPGFGVDVSAVFAGP